MPKTYHFLAICLVSCTMPTPPAAEVPVITTAATPSPPPPQAPPPKPEPEMRMTDSGLGITDLRVGTGPEAVVGKRVTVHYVARLTDDTEFDSSRKRKEPFEFELGAGAVIGGWDEGIVGMRSGGVRRLLIPPALGYGARGQPPTIPPNAILEFEIELLDVQ